jgi:multidrug efflux pump subunit AcrA (membrane-fusion protein)
MPDADIKVRRVEKAEGRTVVAPDPVVRDTHLRRFRIMPLLITLAAVALAVPLSWAMWNAYIGAPWTRDGTVRAYVVTIAPEVAGRVVELPVADNQFVHKGDLLMVIDPTDYRIAVANAEAAVKQAGADAENAAIQAKRRTQLKGLTVSIDEQRSSKPRRASGRVSPSLPVRRDEAPVGGRSAVRPPLGYVLGACEEADAVFAILVQIAES